MTVQETRKAIELLGLYVDRFDGEWRINIPGGTEGTAYYTENNDDALCSAQAMKRIYDRRLVVV
jgi:hypothetical protein